VKLFSDRIDSPIGTLLLISDGRSLCALDYRGYDYRMNAFLAARYGAYELHDAEEPRRRDRRGAGVSRRGFARPR
jgi:methylated-DNA-[protein]-cysteine S-methyltransferase